MLPEERVELQPHGLKVPAWRPNRNEKAALTERVREGEDSPLRQEVKVYRDEKLDGKARVP